MLGRGALVVLASLSPLMVEKLEKPISNVHSWFNGQITIKVVRFYHRIICGYCLSSHLRDQEQEWEL